MPGALIHRKDWGPVRGDAASALPNRRIFITGGTGFVGTWLLEYLHAFSDNPPELFVLSRSPEIFAARSPHLAERPWLHLVQGDVRHLRELPEGVADIVHGATSTSRNLNENNPIEMASTIVHGTENLLRLAAGAGVRSVLFLSSGLAYGRQPADLESMPEDRMGRLDSLDPQAAYGNAKHFAEHLCLQYARANGFALYIARLYAFLGPLLPLNAHFAAGNFIRDGLAGCPIQIKGDGTPLRTYLHPAELADWLWKILVCGVDGMAYNVGSDEVVSIRQLAEAVARQCRVPVEIAGRPKAGALPERYVPDVRRAAGLGLKPILKLEESIALTLAWHHRHAKDNAHGNPGC